MFSSQSFVVTIGNYGTFVSLHQNEEIVNEFVETLNDEAKKKLKTFFEKNISASIYIMLDTTDQSYKKKSYPMMRDSDAKLIAKRDLAADGDKESLKNYVILKDRPSKNKKIKTKEPKTKIDCLFISSPISEVSNQWIEFLLEMPNRLVGIYMAPLESYNLCRTLENFIKTNLRDDEPLRHEIYCLVTHTKVSGTRQMVFSDQGLIFTRAVTYNFKQADFLEKYLQDIYSTFEYLKRLYIGLSLLEFKILNILPSEASAAIEKTENRELRIINSTPEKIAKEINYKKIIPENSDGCDLIISRIFIKNKKILKFTKPQIKALEIFFFTLKTSYFLNLIAILALCSLIMVTVVFKDKVNEIISSAETEKLNTLKKLKELKELSLIHSETKDSGEQAEKIVDFGKMEEALGPLESKIADSYKKLKFTKDSNVKLKDFSYKLTQFDKKKPSSDFEMNFSGDLLSQSGDIEDLIKGFDYLASEVKSNIEGNVKYQEIPRNIDFNKKYYSFPVQFTVTKNSK